MPHVLDDTDILIYPSTSSTDDEPHALPPGLPAAARGGWRFLTSLRCLLAPAPRLRRRPQEHRAPGASRCNTALDILAREYPNSHLQLMAVIG
jgi:hypothetical protein